jgi:hypothetical protein
MLENVMTFSSDLRFTKDSFAYLVDDEFSICSDIGIESET